MVNAAREDSGRQIGFWECSAKRLECYNYGSLCIHATGLRIKC